MRRVSSTTSTWGARPGETSPDESATTPTILKTIPQPKILGPRHPPASGPLQPRHPGHPSASAQVTFRGVLPGSALCGRNGGGAERSGAWPAILRPPPLHQAPPPWGSPAHLPLDLKLEVLGCPGSPGRGRGPREGAVGGVTGRGDVTRGAEPLCKGEERGQGCHSQFWPLACQSCSQAPPTNVTQLHACMSIKLTSPAPALKPNPTERLRGHHGVQEPHWPRTTTTGHDQVGLALQQRQVVRNAPCGEVGVGGASRDVVTPEERRGGVRGPSVTS